MISTVDGIDCLVGSRSTTNSRRAQCRWNVERFYTSDHFSNTLLSWCHVFSFSVLQITNLICRSMPRRTYSSNWSIDNTIQLNTESSERFTESFETIFNILNKSRSVIQVLRFFLFFVILWTQIQMFWTIQKKPTCHLQQSLNMSHEDNTRQCVLNENNFPCQRKNAILSPKLASRTIRTNHIETTINFQSLHKAPK